MRRGYSRLASVEERKNVRTAIFYVVLTVAAAALLFFVGIPILGRFAAFVSDLGKSNKPIITNDKTPPAPPSFNTFPSFTNQKTINLTGNSEAGATVKLTFNGSETDNLADKDGNFSFNNIHLVDGDNIFSAVAVDSSGNVGQKTPDYKIVLNTKAPNLTVDSPADGAQFFGTKEIQVTIKGTTDLGDQVTVNGRIVAVNDQGKYQYTTTLSVGDNKFAVISIDPAGNSTEKDITLSYSQ